MGEKVEKVAGSFLRGFSVAVSAVFPLLRRRVDSQAPATIGSASAATYTVAQVVQGIIVRDPNGASRTDTLPTAALLIAGYPNTYALNHDLSDQIQFLVVNAGETAELITLAAGAGMTLLGNTVFGGGSARVITVTRTSGSTVQAVAVDPLAVPGQANSVVSTIATASAVTFTAAQWLGGYIARDPAGAGRADLVPTAAQLNTASPSLAVGSWFDTTLNNTADAAETITLTTNTGMTLIGTITVAQNEVAVIRTIKTGTAAFAVVKLG